MPSLPPKLAEAAFFIELFEATEQRAESLTHNSDPKTEASYLFSAILGAFYAALDQWHRANRDKARYDAFTKKHAVIYGHSDRGGWRNTTVHVRHLEISHAGYIPNAGGRVTLVFGAPPKLATPLRPGQLVFTPSYYVEHSGKMVEVVSFSRAHLAELAALIEPPASPA